MYIPTQACSGHSLIINPSQGMCQEIHPYGAMSIVCVKINISLLLMMTEWARLDCPSLSNVLCSVDSLQCAADLHTVK